MQKSITSSSQKNNITSLLQEIQETSVINKSDRIIALKKILLDLMKDKQITLFTNTKETLYFQVQQLKKNKQKMVISISDCENKKKQEKYDEEIKMPSLLISRLTDDRFCIEEHNYYKFMQVVEDVIEDIYSFEKLENAKKFKLPFVKKIQISTQNINKQNVELLKSIISKKSLITHLDLSLEEQKSSFVIACDILKDSLLDLKVLNLSFDNSEDMKDEYLIKIASKLSFASLTKLTLNLGSNQNISQLSANQFNHSISKLQNLIDLEIISNNKLPSNCVKDLINLQGVSKSLVKIDLRFEKSTFELDCYQTFSEVLKNQKSLEILEVQNDEMKLIYNKQTNRLNIQISDNIDTIGEKINFILNSEPLEYLSISQKWSEMYIDKNENLIHFKINSYFDDLINSIDNFFNNFDFVENCVIQVHRELEIPYIRNVISSLPNLRSIDVSSSKQDGEYSYLKQFVNIDEVKIAEKSGWCHYSFHLCREDSNLKIKLGTGTYDLLENFINYDFENITHLRFKFYGDSDAQIEDYEQEFIDFINQFTNLENLEFIATFKQIDLLIIDGFSECERLTTIKVYLDYPDKSENSELGQQSKDILLRQKLMKQHKYLVKIK